MQNKRFLGRVQSETGKYNESLNKVKNEDLKMKENLPSSNPPASNDQSD